MKMNFVRILTLLTQYFYFFLNVVSLVGKSVVNNDINEEDKAFSEQIEQVLSGQSQQRRNELKVNS